jgi:hypothetical protein
MLEIILKQFRAILKQELQQTSVELLYELRSSEAIIRTELVLLRKELLEKQTHIYKSLERKKAKRNTPV